MLDTGSTVRSGCDPGPAGAGRSRSDVASDVRSAGSLPGRNAMIELEVTDRVATLTLDDPDRRNVVSAALNDALVAAMDELERRDDVGAVVVTGAGRAFCAGADLDDLAACRDEATL